jgi:LytS/YehU family sensor histidine kinase
MLLIIKDNGPGIKDKIDYGIGLSTTSERLETLYGSEHRFRFENVNSGGCVVTIEIPFKTNK